LQRTVSKFMNACLNLAEYCFLNSEIRQDKQKEQKSCTKFLKMNFVEIMKFFISTAILYVSKVFRNKNTLKRV